jgi:hypothetical protein
MGDMKIRKPEKRRKAVVIGVRETAYVRKSAGGGNPSAAVSPYQPQLKFFY